MTAFIGLSSPDSISGSYCPPDFRGLQASLEAAFVMVHSEIISSEPIQNWLVDVLSDIRVDGGDRSQPMSATSVRLLKAAADIAGGDQALAARLGIGETLLSKFMADSLELPDPLLLRVVDIIIADRASRFPRPWPASLPIF
jgi:hypothetical protein